MAGENEMLPPENGAIVRFYRIGHGDCFLIAFGRAAGERPLFVLIDCGCKNGSDQMLDPARSRSDIATHIIDTTGGVIDVAILSHEHDDHLNGINEENFGELKIDELWLAWTESETDEVAEALRNKKAKQLNALAKASLRLSASGSPADKSRTAFIDELFEMEAGETVGQFINGARSAAAGKAKKEGVNARALRVFRERAKSIKYLYPHEKPHRISGADALKVFVLGPPRDAKKLRDEDPDAGHAFPNGADSAHGLSFEAAVSENGQVSGRPFADAFSVPLAEALSRSFYGGHYLDRYGRAQSGGAARANHWRRIDNDWLGSAENLALQLNTGTNNTSVVIAFELTPGGKILLFAADAQAGNWLSWNDKKFPSGGKDGKPIWPKELLGRTVLYKTGHHGSHNATLKGEIDDEWPNLSWLGHTRQDDEFTAMITAVRKWAVEKAGWDHPLQAIRDALLKKSGGRVFQTDTPPTHPGIASSQAWNEFMSRVKSNDLYFDLTVNPD
jgi:hypothetical protein